MSIDKLRFNEDVIVSVSGPGVMSAKSRDIMRSSGGRAQFKAIQEIRTNQSENRKKTK